MCPACVATAAVWWIAGAGSSGGLLALVAKRRLAKPPASPAAPSDPKSPTPGESGENHERPERRDAE
jgi:hypothetical protein